MRGKLFLKIFAERRGDDARFELSSAESSADGDFSDIVFIGRYVAIMTIIILKRTVPITAENGMVRETPRGRYIMRHIKVAIAKEGRSEIIETVSTSNIEDVYSFLNPAPKVIYIP